MMYGVVQTSSFKLDTRSTVASGRGGAVSARRAGEAGVSVSAPNAGRPPTPTPYGEAKPDPSPRNWGARTPPPDNEFHAQTRQYFSRYW